jgi:hypothetical protein
LPETQVVPPATVSPRVSPPPPATTTVAPPPPSPTTATRARTRRTSWLDNFYFDGGILFGNARPSIPGIADEPFLIQMGLNATIAYKIFAFIANGNRITISAGLMPDYRFSGQYSSLDPTIGNFRGTRFQLLTPTIVAKIEDAWTLKLGVELSGAYNLSRPTYDGNSLEFASPFGVSLTGLYSLANLFKTPRLYGGLQLEYATFGTIQDSAQGTSSLSSSIKMLEFGIAVVYAF